MSKSKLDELIEMGWTQKDFAQLFDELKRKLEYSMLEMLKKDSMEEKVDMLLRDLGMQTHFLGRDFVKTGILYYLDNKNVKSITREIYPYIAKQYQTQENLVERNIRHAIEKMMHVSESPLIDKIWGATIDPKKGKPTNVQFFTGICKYINENYS